MSQSATYILGSSRMPATQNAGGDLVVAWAGAAPLPTAQIDSAGDAASLVVTAAAGVLRELDLCCGAIATHWIQFFDAAALPANGTVPAFPPFQMFTTSSLAWRGTWRAVNGIVVAASTTRATLTVAVGPVIWMNARFN